MYTSLKYIRTYVHNLVEVQTTSMTVTDFLLEWSVYVVDSMDVHSFVPQALLGGEKRAWYTLFTHVVRNQPKISGLAEVANL